jgi:ribonuclease HI
MTFTKCGYNCHMVKQKFYVVWKGRRTGVFNSWAACSAQVLNYPQAEYKSFESLAAAENAFRQNYADYKGKPASLGNWRLAQVKPRLPSLSVDAACAGVPGPLEWRGVETDAGRQIFRLGPFPDGTNNVGEFLAVVHALAWLQEKKLAWPVYSDSEIAILWVKAGKCRTKMAQTSRNADLFALISRAEAWLAENRFANQVLKWETSAWGENPADFGRK